MPVHKDVYKAVDRGEFLKVLATWTRAEVRARELGRGVICFGD